MVLLLGTIDAMGPSTDKGILESSFLVICRTCERRKQLFKCASKGHTWSGLLPEMCMNSNMQGMPLSGSWYSSGVGSKEKTLKP